MDPIIWVTLGLGILLAAALFIPDSWLDRMWQQDSEGTATQTPKPKAWDIPKEDN